MRSILLAFCMVYVCIPYHVAYEQLAELSEEEWEGIVERFVNKKNPPASLKLRNKRTYRGITRMFKATSSMMDDVSMETIH